MAVALADDGPWPWHGGGVVGAGTHLPHSLVGRVTDDEYLAGVCVVSGDLTRYAIKRASVMDMTTVTRIRDVLEVLFGKLLEFDWRNGNIRKKYDGVRPCCRGRSCYGSCRV